MVCSLLRLRLQLIFLHTASRGRSERFMLIDLPVSSRELKGILMYIFSPGQACKKPPNDFIFYAQTKTRLSESIELSCNEILYLSVKFPKYALVQSRANGREIPPSPRQAIPR